MSQPRTLRSFLKWSVRIIGIVGALFLILILAVAMSSFEEDHSMFAATNPHRDLPSDPAVHDTIREILLIRDVLRDGMLPTSLPEDDYDTYSAMLRSLEGREDLTWLVLQETRIDKTIMAIANRGRPTNPIPDEPHDLHGRAKRLHSHWHELALAKDKPERWEARFDVTYLPSLLTGRDIDSSQKAQGHKLELTPAQKARAEVKYKDYRKMRDRAVSYLKENPPKPMAFVPVSRDPETIRESWSTVFPDGIVEAGRRLANRQLAGNPTMKPLYRDLWLEDVPIDWVDPNQPEKEFNADEHLKEMETFRESSRRRDERREKQKKFQAELAAEKMRKRGEKQEL